jgi:hypothetical protein
MLKMQALQSSKRRILYGFAAGLMTLAGVLIMPASAYASVPSGQRTYSAGGGSGFFVWNQSNDSLYMESKPGALSAGQCGDAIFDWKRDDNNPFTSDHHDARIVRNCQPFGFHSASIGPDTGGSLIGMQKAAYCFGPDNATTSGPCTNASDAEQIVQGNVNVNLPNYCVRAWKKNANGTTVYYSGGASTSCTS